MAGLLVVGAFVCINLAAAAIQAQEGIATIQLRNEGEAEMNAKLVGGPPRMVRLGADSNYWLRVKPGNYYFLYQYFDARKKKFIYRKTERFTLEAGAEKTLHEYLCCDDAFMARELTPLPESNETEFKTPQGWPADGVNAESNPHFNTLKLIVAIQKLVLEGESERVNAVYTVKGVLNRDVARNVLLPLRQQGLNVTYGGVIENYAVPESFSEPTLLITYEEREGEKYRFYKGVVISCRLALYGPGSRKSDPMWDRELSGKNDFEVKVNLLEPNSSLRTNSLKQFNSEFGEVWFDFRGWKAGRRGQ